MPYLPFQLHALPQPWLGIDKPFCEKVELSVSDGVLDQGVSGHFSSGLDSYSPTSSSLGTPHSAVSQAPFLGSKILSGGVQIKWGEPAHHVFIAGSSSLVMSALWWSLFLYGGDKEARIFAVLLSTLVPQMVVGGFLSSFLHDTFQITLLEKTLKPWLAKAVKTLHLDDLIRSLKGNQGMPYFDYILKRYRLTSMEYELGLHLLIESKRELLEFAAGRDLTNEENTLLKSFDEKIGNGQALLKEEQDKLNGVGVKTIVDPFSKALTDGTRSSGIIIPGEYLTFLASTTATVGAFIFASGPPQWTENTQALLMYFGIEAFFGMVVGYVYGHVILENVLGYIVRPLEARVNRVVGLKLFPGVADELALPEPERRRNQFDRAVESVRNYAELLNYARHKLAGKANPTPDELERLAVWEDCLKRANQMVAKSFCTPAKLP